MYHIFIHKASEEEARGKASNRDELIELLDSFEIKYIFDHDAWHAIKDVFKQVKKNQTTNESYFLDAKGIQVNAISNGYEITTLVFYF